MTECLKEQINQKTKDKLAGKYLSFSLGAEDFGLEILKVREIIGYMNITPVPRTAHYVKGVINLRGQVLPVVDLRALFDMEPAEVTDQTCIIVVEVSGQGRAFKTGITVDQVREVLDILPDQIEQAPHFDSGVDTSYILGIAKIAQSVKILLNIDKVLTSQEFGQLLG